MKIVESTDINDVRPLFQEWFDKSRGDEFGLKMDLSCLDSSLQQLLNAGGILLVAYDDDNNPMGWMSMSVLPSFSGPQQIAYVTFWYGNCNSSMTGPKLMEAARQWAVNHDCSHLSVGASRLASGCHDSICKYMERIGAKHFETIYFLECV